jgi:MurNAc alpha-1-phosphate uridylyltransferase
MRPATEVVPKAMLEVAGRPFVAWQLELLARGGVDDVLFCTGHLGEQIEDYVGDGSRWGLSVRYSADGETLLGTGGALRLALDRDLLRERFLATYGDAYLSVDLSRLMARLDVGDAPVVMTVWRNAGRIVPSNADFDGSLVVYRKGAPDPTLEYVDYGMLAVRRSMIEGIEAGAVVDLARVLEELSSAGALAGLEVIERCYEIGSPEGLAALAERLRRPA